MAKLCPPQLISLNRSLFHRRRVDTALLVLLAPLSEKQPCIRRADACTAYVIDGDRDTTGSKEGGHTVWVPRGEQSRQ